MRKLVPVNVADSAIARLDIHPSRCIGRAVIRIHRRAKGMGPDVRQDVITLDSLVMGTLVKAGRPSVR
jgi:hypothetical protein